MFDVLLSVLSILRNERPDTDSKTTLFAKSTVTTCQQFASASLQELLSRNFNKNKNVVCYTEIPDMSVNWSHHVIDSIILEDE